MKARFGLASLGPWAGQVGYLFGVSGKAALRAVEKAAASAGWRWFWCGEVRTVEGNCRPLRRGDLLVGDGLGERVLVLR